MTRKRIDEETMRRAKFAREQVATAAARLVIDGAGDQLVVFPRSFDFADRLVAEKVAHVRDGVTAAAAASVVEWLAKGHREGLFK